jgi:phage repressor protein C with HTH and peptisase S24 domain
MRLRRFLPILKRLDDFLSRLFPVVRFTVRENSMLPTLKPGDGVLVFRWFNPHPEQVVVARLANRHIIKRVRRVKDGWVELMGDNPSVEQHLKPIPKDDLVGVVFFVKKAEERD